MFKIMPYFRIAVPDWNCLTGFAMGFIVWYEAWEERVLFLMKGFLST